MTNPGVLNAGVWVISSATARRQTGVRGVLAHTTRTPVLTTNRRHPLLPLPLPRSLP